MNILIIYAHPNEESFCSAIKKKLVEGLKENKNTVRIHDLYSSNFNPNLTKIELIGDPKTLPGYKTIVKYQHDINWANVIIIIHPAWWYGVPAILKGYFDRVLADGFAFTYEDDKPDPKLLNKKGILIQTFDATEEMEKELFDEVTSKSVFYTWTYCGLVDWQHKAMFRVNYVSQEQRIKWLEEICVIGKSIN
ncbi:MAG: NAD(P)H-dependent oxidoreductase [Candidatus Heimdallarchaeota archaeon]|nr:NAD(P)H-dependent oxidoreductase [Candidatus Heimdallarchaeota archaeon]MCK4290758.1 NAD(P)H-dependent oxidoreductase [Candidatus Heimdallarchaeota archaeon]